MKKITFTLLPLLLLLLTGCTADDEPALRERPFTIYIPADSRAGRTPGDPGAAVEMPLPDHLYFYIKSQDALTGTLVTVPEGGWKLVTEEPGHYIYSYSGTLKMVAEGPAAECYAIAAVGELRHSSEPTAENIEMLQFSLADNPDLNLRDLYANHAAVDNTDPVVPRITMTLYHVAAKVDIDWQMTAENQAAGKRLERITLTHLPETGYYFRPAMNEAALVTRLLVNCNEGNNRTGRADAYVLQRRDNTVQATFTFNEGFPEKYLQESGDAAVAPSPYTAWYRLDVTL